MKKGEIVGWSVSACAPFSLRAAAAAAGSPAPHAVAARAATAAAAHPLATTPPPLTLLATCARRAAAHPVSSPVVAPLCCPRPAPPQARNQGLQEYGTAVVNPATKTYEQLLDDCGIHDCKVTWWGCSVGHLGDGQTLVVLS